MPRDAFDLTAGKRFGKHLELKLALRDILNQSIEFKQFSTVTLYDGTTKKIQQTTRHYKPGRNFQLTLTWKL